MIILQNQPRIWKYSQSRVTSSFCRYQYEL